MSSLNERDARRLKIIADKGWGVAQRLAAHKAGKNMDLSDLNGLDLDLIDTKEERLRAYLDLINRSRARLMAQDGTYGQCVSCTATFSDLALDECPWLERCERCSSKSP